MLSMEVKPTHSEAQVRKEARHYFGEMLGLDEAETAEQRRMMFAGGGGYVSLEFPELADAGVLMHTREYEHQVREFARLIG